MLTKVMALDLVEHGITVNSIAPGCAITPMTGFAEQEPTTVLHPEIPIGRGADPREIAAAVAYTRAASLIVDGGLVLG
jgi:NAD(P)-dependent dehydrogenase (short-subunit alcohol dehydrogenase family)